jgi:uncharacterized RDD family membrane protein YckC
MPYCVECGKRIPDDALLCPYCGTHVSGKRAKGKKVKAPTAPFAVATKSGFDALTKDQLVQQYWGRRLLAYVIDAVILSVVAWVLASIVEFFLYGFWYQFYQPYSWFGFGLFPLLWGVVSILYFVFMDFRYGGTMGKSLMGLKVTMDDGQAPTMDKAFVRNISKIHWALLFLDLIAGLLSETDYRKKFTDKFAKTLVVPK